MTTIATAQPDFLAEWDNVKNSITPHDIATNSTKLVWWQCTHGHSWQATPQYRFKGYGQCLACQSLAFLHPEIAQEWDHEHNDITPWEVRSGSGKKVWWKGTCGHSWQAVIRNRVRKQNCP